MYSQILNLNTNQPSNLVIKRTIDNAFIPCDLENSDYQQFKKDLAEGAFLKDAEGNDMTSEQITAFLETLN